LIKSGVRLSFFVPFSAILSLVTVVTWAAEGLNNVSVSEVELKAHLQFFDGIQTSEIHETLIKAAADLISEESPDYQYLAARLNIFHLRKKAYGRFEPPALYDHVTKLVESERYDRHLLEDYSAEDQKTIGTKKSGIQATKKKGKLQTNKKINKKGKLR